MTMVQVVSVESVQFSDYHVIDVRSPGEFNEFHVIGAQNIPIFNNDERAKVGTTYKQVGKDEAKMQGLSIVSPKLVNMVHELKQLQLRESKPFLIYCARGGMRSNSFATVMSLMGFECAQLNGGIRSYRQLIVSTLASFAKNSTKFVILEGLTGSRKTDLLEILEEDGYPVINLERMAGHRGSIFGEIGNQGRSQKSFDQSLYLRLQEIGSTDYYMIESESKRIGKVIVPEWILQGKEEGTRIYLHYPLNKRVESICNTYKPLHYHHQISEALMHLRKRLAPELYEEVTHALENRNYHTVVRLLLEFYYDPKYEYTANQYERDALEVHLSDLDTGLSNIKDILTRL
ncbi:tRNA 2-selenouridine(34) synthase MnmH [Pseudalkalibacillus berkeleyi]|uniref:tRNA 2-selenouridine(34) synthase MnmH n=1 Tax=Pseudalkalibacillus berkeleyi TaxID=1069813 RepID=A0ABS9H0N8_9BACL|nr:tRNA 2-selenouridine(34) synthase MnmH [Pseudalkalibacillus berkeleyi]MCF6137215.1 tRNA 2-selenouridine(34) synthase MnmH [Pseudalkalibacillus berkeleyi]